MKRKGTSKRTRSIVLFAIIGFLSIVSFQNFTGGLSGADDPNSTLSGAEFDVLQSNKADLDAIATKAASTQKPKVGIAYMVWHCMANSPTRNKVIAEAVNNGDWGNIPEFHWRDVPAATNSIKTYCARDKNLVRKHFEQLEAAQVDFLVVDFTNQSYVPGGSEIEEVAPQSMIDGFQNLLDVSVERGGKIKVVPWVSFKGNLHTHFLQMMGLQPLQSPNPYEKALFYFEGKPLIIASWDKARGQHNVEAAISTVEAAGVTVRKMWGLHRGDYRDASGRTVWSFMELCKPGFKDSRGYNECEQYTHPELASVSAAYQETFMTDFRTAVPKFSGRTFLKQLKTAQKSGASLVVLNTWNEWIAQRFCLKDNLPTHECYSTDGSGRHQHFPFDGRPVFVDSFDREYSRDFEPDTAGAEYYVLMKAAISALKGGAQVCSPDSKTSCSTSGGTGEKTCNSTGSAYGSCIAKSCNSGYTLSGGKCVTAQACTPNKKVSCTIANGFGQQTCNSAGSAYGSCVAVSCKPGYSLTGGQCKISSGYSEIQTVVASVGGVVGQTGAWWCVNHFGKNLGGSWACLDGNCSSTVSLGQTITCGKKAPVCVANSTTSCSVANGSGTKTCNSAGSAYGSCVATSCYSGYVLSGGQCVVKQACTPNSSSSCAVTNGVGQKTCSSDGSAYGSCKATSCSLGYVVSNGQCVLSSAYSDVKTVVAYVGGVVGQTGAWWCTNHFGHNLGGSWVCLAGSCSSTVSLNEAITCAKLK